VVIVSYNVRHYLTQCLDSVRHAAELIDGEVEVWVVDNASKDDSVHYIQKNYPWVKLIANEANTGFSKANNQAITQAKGKYTLILNPDTIVAEDAFVNALSFWEGKPHIGAIGPMLLDAQGRFAPESKRGLPTLQAAAYKMVGISKLFPKSAVFNSYYLGHTSPDEAQPIEVMSGACMFVQTPLLQELGGFDERFFMYGEDIDLSYRITKAGFQNWYLPSVKVLHYKGESTKRGSTKYIQSFYGAMALFAEKHFSSGQASTYKLLTRTLITLRMALAFFQNAVAQGILPLLDGALAFGSYVLIKRFWQHNALTGAFIDYPPSYIRFVVPCYVLLWLLGIWLSGGYDKPYRPRHALRGIALSTALILIVYALLPEDLRYSRVLLLLGAGASALWAIALRAFLAGMAQNSFPEQPKTLIVAENETEATQMQALLLQTGMPIRYLGELQPQDSMTNLAQSVLDLGAQQVVVSSQISSTQLFDLIQSVASLATSQKPLPVYRIAQTDGHALLGKSFLVDPSDVFTLPSYTSLAAPGPRRSKRLFDIALAFSMLVGLPILAFRWRNPIKALGNLFAVLFGNKTFIGYSPIGKSANHTLPSLKPATLPLKTSPTNAAEVNLAYGKFFTLKIDWEELRQRWRELGD
jgi:GT2 family glycosyltransferase